MKIDYGNGQTEYGPGVDIKLTGTEVAEAISLWLHTTGNLTITGPRTITVNGDLCAYGNVYVDPSGSVRTQAKTFSGRGEPSTRKYEQEYKLYCEYIEANGFALINYGSWAEGWEKETPARRELILGAYKQAITDSVKPLTSLQERSAVESAFCFTIDVTLMKG